MNNFQTFSHNLTHFFWCPFRKHPKPLVCVCVCVCGFTANVCKLFVCVRHHICVNLNLQFKNVLMAVSQLCMKFMSWAKKVTGSQPKEKTKMAVKKKNPSPSHCFWDSKDVCCFINNVHQPYKAHLVSHCLKVPP